VNERISEDWSKAGQVAYTNLGDFLMVFSVAKKWAQRAFVHVRQASCGRLLVVPAMPHAARILLLHQPSASSGALIASVGLLFWPAVIFTVSRYLRPQTAGSSPTPARARIALRRPRPLKIVALQRHSKPELH
jgi:hypothetical protein